MKLRVWIGGLSPAGNLGAPALGLTVYEELKKRYPDLEYIMVIPPNWPNLAYQKKWAKQYGIRLLYLYPLSELFNKKPNIRLLIKNWRTMAKSVKADDIFIEEAGISYVDGIRSVRSTLNDFSHYLFCRLTHMKYIRFVQSFGPIDRKLTKKLARIELSSLIHIYCRGGADVIKPLIKKRIPIENFPDIALKLPYHIDDTVRNKLIQNGLTPKRYAVVIPSEVIYNASGVYSNHKYIHLLETLVTDLISKGFKVLILPHKYTGTSRIKSDYDICMKLKKYCDNQACGENDSVVLFKDEFDVYNTKGIISEAALVITSRYHGLVAALSTDVPPIVLGWNRKYLDLLQYYALEKYYVDLIQEKNIEKRLHSLIEDALNDSCIPNFEALHKENIACIDHAFSLLFSDIETYARGGISR